MKNNTLLFIFTLFQLTVQAQLYDAELILFNEVVRIKGNTLKKNVSIEIRINSRAGEKYTKVRIPFSNLNKLSKIEAYIKDSDDNTVRTLKRNEIIEKSAISDFSLYEDEFTKEFVLKHNSYPYTICYSFQLQQDEFLFIEHWTPAFDIEIPTYNASLNLTIPDDYEIKYKSLGIEKPIIDSISNETHYHWHASYTNLVESETHSPPLWSLLPQLIITPSEYTYDISGSLKDWISYGNWQYDLIKNQNELPEEEKSRILSMTEAAQNDRDKIRRLYHYLQDETRYINIKIETGGLKPYPAEYVAQNKYGDCKALTNYFKSLLEYIGINAYYAKINAGSQIRTIDTKFPSQQFNHVILYIPLQDGPVWLDCTSKLAFNYLGTFTQNRNALIIDHNKSHFIKTPTLKPSDVLETRKITVEHDKNESIINFRNCYKGELYENLLQLERNFDKAYRQKIIQAYLLEKQYKLNKYEVKILDRDSVMLKVSLNATSPNIYKHYGDDILVSNIPFTLPKFEKPENRSLDVQIDYPVCKVDTLIYELPKGMKVSQKPSKNITHSRYGHYNIQSWLKGNKIFVAKSVLINSGIYPVTIYGDFFKFYEAIIAYENSTNLLITK